MVTHMKTTVELADALLEEARATARRDGTTVRSILEMGLRAELERRRTEQPFRLRDGSVGGGWLRPSLGDAGWGQVLEFAYDTQSA